MSKSKGTYSQLELVRRDFLKAMAAAGHVVRTAHPFDGRALEVSLSRSGMAAHKRAHQHWEVMRKQIERNLAVPADRIEKALSALQNAAERTVSARARRSRTG